MMTDKDHDSLCLSKTAEKTRNCINPALKQTICLILG